MILKLDLVLPSKLGSKFLPNHWEHSTARECMVFQVPLLGQNISYQQLQKQ